jgi:GntR family transcriptional regulator
MSKGKSMSDNQPARYEQIAEFLRGLVSTAEPGDRLPSEAELCARFGVSRMTARQAMQKVANDGLIVRRRGAGTFVRDRPVPRDLGSPLSFSGSMRARGMTVCSETLEWGEMTPDEAERSALGLERGERGYVLERLRRVDGTPMAIERVVMPRDLALSLDPGFQDGSLHEAFRRTGRIPTEAHAVVSARRAHKRERELLGLPPSATIISERRTIYDQDGDALERTETRYAANRYSFSVILRNSRGES